MWPCIEGTTTGRVGVDHPSLHSTQKSPNRQKLKYRPGKKEISNNVKYTLQVFHEEDCLGGSFSVGGNFERASGSFHKKDRASGGRRKRLGNEDIFYKKRGDLQQRSIFPGRRGKNECI